MVFSEYWKLHVYNRPLPIRKIIRKRDWDYRAPAAYFIIICTKPKRPLFGTIESRSVCLSKYGQIASDAWVRGAEIIPNIITAAEDSIIMPDHMHGIIWILDEEEPDLRDPRALYERGLQRPEQFEYPHNRQRSIGAIVGGDNNLKIWHRGYHDHIIRDNRALIAIRAYIRNNPVRATRGVAPITTF